MLLELMFATALAAQEPVGPAAIEACRRSDEPWSEERASDEAGCLIGAIYGRGQLEVLDTLGRDAPLLFSRAALADMEAARARSGGGLTSGLDAVPFCGCQDPSGLTLLATMEVVHSDGTGAVGLTFTFEPIHEGMDPDELLGAMAPELRETLRLNLVYEDGGWRVDDIVWLEGGSFRASLQP